MQFTAGFLQLLLALGLSSQSAGLKLISDPEAVEVAKLHAKMEHVAVALEGMLDADKGGSLASSAVAPTMRIFLKELNETLASTEHPSNATDALLKLKAAHSAVGDLTQKLTAQQENLMHQSESEEVSLLMGVLMTRRNKPRDQQLEVLLDPQFANLAVTKEILAKNDESTPLFQQVAAWMDTHGNSNVTDSHSADEDSSSKQGRLAKTLTYFQRRVEILEHEEARMEKAHNLAASKFDALIKNSTSKEANHRLSMLKHRSDREYKKRYAVQHNQLEMMRTVVSALKKGDVKALEKAQEALQASMKAMQKQNGNFLHLLQIGHELQAKDCPYCAAQCIEKCHNEGKPYVECLTSCDGPTAGK
eukprot:CAMPEP_0206446616 /NCGR_PEP_ID=MMETSP0324_2-20121206/16242_1 /ASSEMBLY_ACC=CAM_ASM_000836 /TAXON_ID=2866 /ORGANISM="Crypthecodinium cohnii, Strain Seligo" /LENGTH=361 /DNA_ID=CAMNT_0053915121 /DNA_START=88 /DNA_END=1173 /DNA_ORIENTATION=-